MKINNKDCILFESKKIHSEAINLCDWFAENILKLDPDFDIMRSKSGDNLNFGYKSCGLTLVDSKNCPTNSIPLLWYNNLDTDIKPKYKGPYPRVQSRKGIQKEQPVGNSWKKIIDKENEIFNIIQNLYNDKKG